MKKVLTLILVLVLTLTLSSCNDDKIHISTNEYEDATVEYTFNKEDCILTKKVIYDTRIGYNNYYCQYTNENSDNIVYYFYEDDYRLQLTYNKITGEWD